MTKLSVSPLSNPSHLLAVLIRGLLAVAATMAVGVGLGIGLTTPAAPIVTSLIVMAALLGVLVVSPIHGLLLWLVIYPFVETRIVIDMGQGIANLSVTRLVLASLASLLLAQAAIGRRKLRPTALDFCGLLFAAGIGLSAFASPDVIGSLRTILDSFVTPLLFFILVRNYITDRRQVEWLLSALLVVGAYTALLAINEQLTGQILFGSRAYTLTEYADGIRVLRSLWGNNAIFGSVLAFALPIAFYRALDQPRPAHQVGYLLLTGLLLAGLFLTFKRASWISAFVSLFILAALWPPFRRVALVLLLAAIVPVALSWDRLSDSDLVEQRLSYNVDSLNGRTVRWEAAVDLVRRSPVWGHGFRSFDRLSGFQAVENHYLHLLVSGGLAAFVPFMLFLALTIWQGLRVLIRGPSRALAAIFFALLATYLIKGFTGIQDTPINLMMFIVIGAMIGSPALAPAPTAPPAAAKPAAAPKAAP